MTKRHTVLAPSDLLAGAEAIAAYLSMSPRQIYNLHDVGELPTFKLGAKVCARRSILEKHFAALEAETMRARRC